MGDDNKIVSVVITTKNEEKNIEACLKSIRRQSYPQENIEIIVVDNNSADQTQEIAAKFTSRIYNYGPERSAQRNFGIRKASGEYILYLDTDMALSGDVIAKAVTRCESEQLAGLYIPERIEGSGFWIRVRDFERSFYNATAIDCVRFIKRDKVLEIGGFDEALTGPEDWDFDRRIRQAGRVGMIESPIYHNEGEFNLKRYLNKKNYYARCFDGYVNKWGKDDPDIKKQLGFYYRYFKVFVENGKWRELLRHPALTPGMYLLKIAVGVRYLGHKWKIQRKAS